METSRVAQLPWEPLGSLPSDIAQRNHPVLQSPQQRLIGLEPVLVSRLYQEAKMQIGDLVKIDYAADGEIGIVLALHTNETATVHFPCQASTYELWRERLEVLSG